jgi:hypothetical protein
LFPELKVSDSGAKLSTVSVPVGMAYVSFYAVKGDQLTLHLGHETLTLTEPVHLRVAIDKTTAQVAVFKGQARVEGPSGTVEISKNHWANFDLTKNDEFKLAKDVPEFIYDSWDKKQDQYLQRYAKNGAYNAPYSYGSSDLNYYGNFFTVPGYGTMWQPYFVGTGWNPYMDGAWAWYPGFGYSWVSAYPWGWTPFHYGSWVFLPNYGWAWQPGGSWAGLGNLPATGSAPHGFVSPRPPSTPVHSLVMVNHGPVGSPAINSSAMSTNRMVIRSGSAGLGVPRGSINNMGRISQQVAQRGTMTTSIHNPSPASMGSFNRGMAQSPAAARPGYAPSATGMPSASSRQSMPAPSPSMRAPGGGGFSAPAPASRASSNSSGTRR